MYMFNWQSVPCLLFLANVVRPNHAADSESLVCYISTVSGSLTSVHYDSVLSD